jgi:hypothetical protein
MNKTAAVILAIIIVLLVGGGAYYLHTHTAAPAAPATTPEETATTTQPEAAATTTAQNPGTEVIGTSAGGRDIVANHYGTGSTEILFVGGVHGGYSYNTSLLAYQLMDYLAANPSAVPANERVTVIPELNPDGIAKVVGSDGRFAASDIPASADTVAGRVNANGVDVDRNFDCNWQASATWQNKKESGGTAAFSEPEAQAIQSYVTAHKPAAAVVFFSAAGGVYASACGGSPSKDDLALMNLYAKASGYPASASFDSYSVTGDMVDWFAKVGIPGISVLLTNHTSTEWDKNLAGIKAVLAQYAQ